MYTAKLPAGRLAVNAGQQQAGIINGCLATLRHRYKVRSVATKFQAHISLEEKKNEKNFWQIYSNLKLVGIYEGNEQ